MILHLQSIVSCKQRKIDKHTGSCFKYNIWCRVPSFSNLLTSSWKGHRHAYTETGSKLGTKFQKVLRVHRRARSVLMQQMFVMKFFSTYNTFLIHCGSGHWWPNKKGGMSLLSVYCELSHCHPDRRF